MKIKKYALGAVFTPMAWDMGMGAESNQTQPTAQSTSASQEGLNYAKEIFQVTNKSGLYADRRKLAAEAGRLIDVINNENISNSVKQKMLVQLQMKANDVTNNYALWKSASEKISKEDLGSDLAMDSRGRFFVIDNESLKVTTKSLEDIKDNSDKYHMFTWNELLDARNNYPTMAFDMNSIQSISSAIGMSEIMKQVTEIVSKIGKDTNAGYTTKAGNNVQEGLEYLFAPMHTEQGMYLTAADGLYELKRTDSKAAQSIDAAVNYIFSHLSDGAKNVVRANAFKMGFENPSQLIELAIVENIDSSRELKYVKPDDLTGKKSGSGSGSGGSEQMTPDSWGHYVFSDKGLPSVDNITLGGNVRMSLPSRQINNVLTKEGNQLGITRFSQSYRNLQEWGLVDTNGSVYFGDIPLTSPSLEGYNIIIDNKSGIHVVDMPVYDNGEINWELYNVMNEIQESIVEERITDQNEVAEIWAKNGFLYNPETKMGVPQNMKSRKFMVQKAYSSTKNDELSDKLSESSVLEEAPDGIIEFYQKQYNVNPLENKDKIDLEAGWFGHNYQGLVFIPMTSNQNEVLVSSKIGYIPKPNSNEIKAYQDTNIHHGGYDYGTRQFKGLEGTTVDDL